ncbi:MAG: type II toxin-antitoxin system RelE/ParE family toxin [Planctomycetes bacterium]|nr:type II toxin-antitoxin system RelE/ParE family toxin [Planctomycetota bacterium]
MRFEVIVVPSAQGDLAYYAKHQQTMILDALAQFLTSDPGVETRRKKRLRDNPLAPWELRIADFRAFYEVRENQLVRVLAIGHKVHNELFIRGERLLL